MLVLACVSSTSFATDCGRLRSTSPSPAGSEVHSIQWLLSCSALWESKKVWAVTSYSLPYVVLQGYNCYLQNDSRHVGTVTWLLAAILEALIFSQQQLWRPACKTKCTTWPCRQKWIYVVYFFKIWTGNWLYFYLDTSDCIFSLRELILLNPQLGLGVGCKQLVFHVSVT